MRQFYVYILTNKFNTTFYIGVTNNLNRRIFEHKNKLVKGFTSKYNLTKLVYIEIYQTIFQAIDREKQLKRWHKDWKMNLIKESNPTFKDLYDETHQFTRKV
jgi:putative endonuclease